MSTSIESFMKTATKEQRDLLFQLSNTAEQENKYANKVNQIYNSMKKGIYSSDGFSVTVCEDAGDAMVISAGHRQELQRLRKEVKGCMEKAVELGMGHLGLIQRNYEHYVGKPLTK